MALDFKIHFYKPVPESFSRQLASLTDSDFEKSIDQGGHGGAIKIKKPIGGKYLFLKPEGKDGTEARNYQLIGMEKEVARWMPQVFGELKIRGKSYLVMENLLKTAKGKKLSQLVDIKLAGKVKGLYNPILCNKEIKLTRGKEKSIFTKIWMLIVALLSPGYLITKGGFRLWEYIRSESILKKSLSQVPKHHLRKLSNDLWLMECNLKKGPFAFIGASVVLIHQRNGGVKPVLLDPAHVQYSKKLKGRITERKGDKIFYECNAKNGLNQYGLYKKSNAVALRAIRKVVDSL
jgi:hypothetical protein